MRILPLQPNTPEWLEARRMYDCSSDAAAMLNQDAHRLRNDLVRLRALGDTKLFTEWEQKYLLDSGHEVERLAMAIVESEVDEMVTPVVIANNDGTMLASLDGATILFDHVFEHKKWNKELVAYIRENKDLPPSHWPQLEHILLASDGEIESITFIVSDGTAINRLMHEYTSQPKRRKAIANGWPQLREDVKNYKHVDLAPKAVGTSLRPLPQLNVIAIGSIQTSNFEDFKEASLGMIRAIPTDLKTDQDFADAENAIKWLKDGEEQCDKVKSMVLAGASSINEIMLGLDEIRETMRNKRLPLNSLVGTRKTAIRAEIAAEGREAIQLAHKEMDAQLGKPGLLVYPDEFIGDRMAGKRTVATLRNAMESEVARVKAQMRETVTLITANLQLLGTPEVMEHGFLFSDSRDLVLKPSEDLETLIGARIIEHKRKEEERLERERERIRAEEQERAEREARDRERVRQREEQEQAELRRKEQLERDRIGAPEVERQSDARDLLGHTTRTTPTEPATIEHPANLPVDAGPQDASDTRDDLRTRLDEAPRRRTLTSRETLLKQKPDDEPFEEWVIACVANQYDVDVQIAAAWLLTMNVEGITERHALQGLLGGLF